MIVQALPDSPCSKGKRFQQQSILISFTRHYAWNKSRFYKQEGVDKEEEKDELQKGGLKEMGDRQLEES